ncbi:MAG: hypothetical protein ACT4P4_29140 [Betaproteobacteria bacterium]
MRAALAALSQVSVMAAIVASMLYWPIGIALALLLALAGIPLRALLTFGDNMAPYFGMLAWWLIAFVLALVYAALVFPWGVHGDFRRK